MNSRDAIKSVFTNYANFRGVATRAEFWWFYAFTVLMNFIFNRLPGDGALGNAVDVLALVYSVGILVPSIAVTVRRFHDAGFSGKWLLLWIAPFIAGVFALGAAFPYIMSLFQTEAIAESDVLAIAAAILPAMIVIAPVAIFQFVVTVLPSKSAEAGNTHAAA